MAKECVFHCSKIELQVYVGGSQCQKSHYDWQSASPRWWWTLVERITRFFCVCSKVVFCAGTHPDNGSGRKKCHLWNMQMLWPVRAVEARNSDWLKSLKARQWSVTHPATQKYNTIYRDCQIIIFMATIALNFYKNMPSQCESLHHSYGINLQIITIPITIPLKFYKSTHKTHHHHLAWQLSVTQSLSNRVLYVERLVCKLLCQCLLNFHVST